MKTILRTTVACAAFALAACGDGREEIELSDAPASGAADEAAAPSETSGSESASAAATGGARQGIRIVGSSTVFPFTTAVAESFGAKTQFPTPVVESTGTGGGMALFCSGVGLEYPDLTGASRPIKASEYALCQENGVTAVTEIPIGFDGIVIGNSLEASAMDIDKAEIWLALAARIPTPVDSSGAPLFDAEGRPIDGASFAEVAGYSCESFIDNPHQRWSDVDPELSNARIEVFGPPPTSGTRDAFVELAMEQGAEDIECVAALADSDSDMFDRVAARLREDGAWVDSGENDNAIVQTLANTPSAFGIFGYSFLEQNTDRIHASTINGVEPTYDNIAEGVYPVSRSLFVYVKNQHVGVAPGIEAFIAELTSEETWGPFGYLAERGLIAMPEARRAEERDAAMALEPLDGVGEE